MTHAKDGLPILLFEARETWDVWLDEHGGSSGGLWLRFAKKGSGLVTLSYDEALEEALRHGWIDGLKHAFDDTSFLLRFTPRKPRSKWSRINRDKALDLIDRGLMKPAGLAQVEAARADGRWEAAYESQSRMPVPDDLRERLDAHPRAKAFFETISAANRYAILYRVHDAKRPETRARRIDQFVAMLAEGRTIH